MKNISQWFLAWLIAFAGAVIIPSIAGEGLTLPGATKCTALSDAGTACQKNTGTSGATVPLNNGANTWSGAQAFGSNTTIDNAGVITAGSQYKVGGGVSTTLDSNIIVPGVSLILSGTAIPAGGTASLGYRFSSASNFGIFFGSGPPTLAAAKGSLYLRSDGTGIADRAYIDTDGGTTWTNLVTGG